MNAIPRLHFPGMCFQDAGNGARNTDFVSSWPSGLHVAASWNRNLTLQRGQGMGGEFRTKGGNVFLGPVVGPLGEYWQDLSVVYSQASKRSTSGYADNDHTQGEPSQAAEIGKDSHLTPIYLALSSTRLCLESKVPASSPARNTSLATSKRANEGRAGLRNQCLRISMIRQCMSFTCGLSLMPSMQDPETSCVPTRGSTTAMAAQTVPL